MEWKEFAANFGLPGLMLAAIAYVIKMWNASNERNEAAKIASNERIEMARLKVEDKKADAMATGFLMLASKIDAHHTTDIQSHQALSNDIAELRGSVDQSLLDRTPVDPAERIPAPRRETSPRGIPIESGYYPPARPKTQGGR